MSALQVYRDAPAAVGLRPPNDVYVSEDASDQTMRCERKNAGWKYSPIPNVERDMPRQLPGAPDLSRRTPQRITHKCFFSQKRHPGRHGQGSRKITTPKTRKRKKRGLRGDAVPRLVWAFVISRSRRKETAGRWGVHHPARPGRGRASMARWITMPTTAVLACDDGVASGVGVTISGAGEAVSGAATSASRSIVPASKARQIVRPAMKRRAQAYPSRRCRS